VGDRQEGAAAACAAAGITPEAAQAVYRLTALAGMKQRVVIPSLLREQAAEALEGADQRRREMGFGSRRRAKRRW
ncbi:MAG: nitrate reductase subunit beta, partial [Desulfuromonadales bacterium]|nr:nitrate reductase subunit beta [Desulfuromonadales bacterium]